MKQEILKGVEKAKATLSLKKNLVAMDYLNEKKTFNSYVSLIKEGLNMNRQGFKAQIGINGLKKFYNIEISRHFLTNLLNTHDEVSEKEKELNKHIAINGKEKDGMEEIKRRDFIAVLKSILKPLRAKETAKISGFLREYDFKTLSEYREVKTKIIDKKRVNMDIYTYTNPNLESSKFPQQASLSSFANVENWKGERFFSSSYAFVIGKEFIQTETINEKIVIPKNDKRIDKFKRYTEKGEHIKPSLKPNNNNARRYPTLTDSFIQPLKMKSHEDILKNMGLYDKYRITQGLSIEEVKTLNEIKQ